MIKVFGIFPVEIVKEDFPGEGLMDVAVIKGITPGTQFGVFYGDKLLDAAIAMESRDFVLTPGAKEVTKEQIAEEKVCPDFNVDVLERRLG